MRRKRTNEEGSKKKERIKGKRRMIMSLGISRVMVSKAKDMRFREVDILTSLNTMTVITTRHNSEGIQTTICNTILL
jgi:hypothetical protein